MGSTYSAKGIAKTRLPCIEQGISFAKDEWELVFGEEGGFIDLFGDGGDIGAMIHEGVLQSYPGRGGAADVAAREMVSGWEWGLGI
jgi:hypothetical protein